jgi:hypothetical protein
MLGAHVVAIHELPLRVRPDIFAVYMVWHPCNLTYLDSPKSINNQDGLGVGSGGMPSVPGPYSYFACQAS